MSKPLAFAVFFSMTALFSEPAAVLAQATTPSPTGEAELSRLRDQHRGQ